MKTKKVQRSHAWNFLNRAAIYSVLFLIVHLLGLRQYTSVLSGTASFGYLQRLGGGIYLAFYFLFIFYVPILLIASGLAKAIAVSTRSAIKK